MINIHIAIINNTFSWWRSYWNSQYKTVGTEFKEFKIIVLDGGKVCDMRDTIETMFASELIPDLLENWNEE